MKNQKVTNNPLVKIVSDKTNMKFRPTSLVKSVLQQSSSATSQPKSSSILSWFRKPKKLDSDPNSSGSTTANTSANQSVLQGTNQNFVKSQKLKFLHNLSNESFLIGNQHQVDLINIAHMSQSKSFIETQYLWSINLKKKLDLIAVDEKKLNLFAIVSGKTLYIYKYDHKKMNIIPPIFDQVTLEKEPKFLQITRDSTISVLYEEKLDIFIVTDTKVRKKFSKKYEFPSGMQGQVKIMMVPKAFQTILNIFFEQVQEDKTTTFALWCIQLEFLPAEIKISTAEKIYDIKNSLKSSLKITNYSREIFLMNLGSEVLALKRGYILDSATVNMKSQQSQLYYLGSDTLLHISKKKVQVYSFSIKTFSKPYRISINPKDSIILSQSLNKELQFFNIVQLLGNNFALFFQTKQEYTNLSQGELQYSFYLTFPITRAQKIDNLFPRQNFQELLHDPSLGDRCDMAQKMGLSIKEIYLQLWNRSSKKTEDDYRLLKCTRDYETIQYQICKKLKKASMSFKEVKKIEDDCFEMLEQSIFSLNCSEDSVLQYITSHFFRRKLEMYKDQFIMKIHESTHGKLEITIQQYQNLKQMQLINYLQNLVSIVCFEEKGKEKALIQIRLLIKNFKFVFRTIYYEVLESIIKVAKDQLLVILKQIPEILPYEHDNQEPPPVPQYYEGVWSQINQREWKQSLYADSIITIDNRQIIQDKIIKGLWFRRHWLSQHDMVTDSRHKIKQNWENIRTQNTFFFFISKIFDNINNQEVLKNLIDFIQQKYVNNIPEKIKGKVFLLHKNYVYLEKKQILPLNQNKEPLKFSEFLNLEFHEFFRHLFLKERSLKGLLLKQIKPLCQETSEQGIHLFNEGLLKYFSSDISEVSDLKYILNRINNQKVEFHRKNQEMYEILVEALQRKLKIGTDDDIPIEEVLIYIENIPLKVTTSKEDKEERHCKALQELKCVQKINNEIEALRQAKLGMSLYDILHNSEEVLTKLVNHEVNSQNLFSLKDDSEQTKQEIKKITYIMIATLQSISQEIYEDPKSLQIFFIYLSKLCERQPMVKHVKLLLQDEHLAQCYDETTAESLVQYMYRWKLCENKRIVQSQQYIRQLLTLIPEDSTIYQYISSELQFSLILSTKEHPIEFPISIDAPTVWDVKQIIDKLGADDVLKINLEQLHFATATMEKIANDLRNSQNQDEELQMKPVMTLHQTYEIVIIKLIKCGKLKQVLKLMKSLLSLPIPDPTYNIIYPILYIIQIAPELNEENKKKILQCISHFFYDYWQLLQIVETLVTRPLNAIQRKDYINQKLKLGKANYRGFNISNKIFKQQKIQALKGNRVYEEKFMYLLNERTIHLQHTKEEFSKINYAIIMTMLHNSPYALAKYINCKDALNLKFLRSFLSYIIKEDVFDPVAVLELGRRIFLIILYVLREKIPIEMAINQYSALPLTQDIEVQLDVEDIAENEFQLKIWKSVEAFKKKKQIVKQEIQKNKELAESLQERKSRFTGELEKVQKKSNQQEPPNQYPFNDSDDQDEGDALDIRQTGYNKRFKDHKFQPIEEREKLLKKKGGNANLFMSIGNVNQIKKANQFTASIRPKLRNMNTLTYDDFNDLEKKKSGSDKKNMRDQIFDDIDLRESNPIGIGLTLTPQKVNEDEKVNANSSPEIRINTNERIEEEREFFINSKEGGLKLQVNNSGNMRASLDSKAESMVSNPYRIQINQVEEEQSFNQEEIKINLKESIEFSPKKIQQKQNSEQMIATMAQNVINDSLDAENFDFKAIQSIENNVLDLRSFVKYIYENHEFREKMKKNIIIQLLMVLNQKLPLLDLNKEVLTIYSKAESLQTKFVLELPFDEIFSTEGIFRKFVDKQQIFYFIYPNIKKILDDSNIHKISKMVTLIFGGQYSFEPLIIFQHLCSQIVNHSAVTDYLQVKRLTQKITALVGKLEVDILVQKFEELYESLKESKSKNKILKAICDEVKSRTVDKEKKKQFMEVVVQKDQTPIYKRMLNLL